MSATEELSAAEVFAIIEEPTAQGKRAKVLKFVSALLGHPIPDRTHPVLVEKATGKTVQGYGAEASWLSGIRTDLESLSAEEFRARYINL